MYEQQSNPPTHLAILQVRGELNAAAVLRRGEGLGEPTKPLLVLPSNMVVIAALNASRTMRFLDRGSTPSTRTKGRKPWFGCFVGFPLRSRMDLAHCSVQWCITSLIFVIDVPHLQGEWLSAIHGAAKTVVLC